LRSTVAGVGRAAFVGLHVPEGDPAQGFHGDHALNGTGDLWEEEALAAVEQERFIAGQQELVEREPCSVMSGTQVENR
jgi:hypothetical protein